VTVSNGFNIGWIQNDGTGGGYRRGKISPFASTSGRGNIQADDFMGRSWNKFLPLMIKDFQKIPSILDGRR